MPIVGPASYVPATQAFLDHWAEVNAALPAPQPLTLPNPTASPAVISTRANFQAARTALLDQRDLLEDLDLEVSFARASLDLKRAQLHAWMNLFNDKVRGAMGGTAYARSLADVPGVDAGLEVFTKPMKRSLSLWAKIDSDAPPGVTVPLLLQDGTNMAAFLTAVNALGMAFDAVTTAETLLTVGLEKRNDLQVPLYAAMKAYRLAVPGRFMPDNALVESLPGLTAEGGRTPDAVSLSAEWDAGALDAKLTVGESSDPELKEYGVRYCVGPDYDIDHEHVAGTIAAGGPLIFHTTKGVASPGAVGSYRVYVILNSGHEAGSATAVVARPA